jgi:hypothetical protein
MALTFSFGIGFPRNHLLPLVANPTNADCQRTILVIQTP